jgi:CHAT domain-containing protein
LKDNFSALSEYEKENFYQNVRKDIVHFNQFCLIYLESDSKDKSTLMNKMLDWNLATKAIILNENRRLTKTIYESNDPELVANYEKWKSLKNEYGLITDGNPKFESKRSDLLGEINRVEKLLLKSNSGVKLEFVDWQQIQKSLPKGSVGVEIIRVPVDSSSQYVFLSVSSEGEPKYEVVKDGRKLEKQYTFYKNCINADITDVYSRKVFWRPIANLVEENTKVYLSPDGIYNLVNLDILPNADHVYLSEEYNIYNLTSLKDLVNEAGTISSLDGILIGRPEYYTGGRVDQEGNPEDLQRELIRGSIAELPGTEFEVKAIKEILENNNYTEKLLLGAEAEESTIKQMELSPVIHFATHGFFNQSTYGDTDPMLHTGLLLRGAGDSTLIHGEDGILTAYEATTLDLKNTNLVVLSACETGLGTIQDGEGVYGLQRAFKVADVDYVIMAMWKVNDSATELLFRSFYGELVKNKDVHESLKAAQNIVKLKYPGVRYWGAFKVIGK